MMFNFVVLLQLLQGFKQNPLIYVWDVVLADLSAVTPSG